MAITIKLIPDTPYTETIVDVSDTELKALATTKKLLLPALPTGKYYTGYMIWEFTEGSAIYSVTGDFTLTSVTSTGTAPNNAFGKVSRWVIGSGAGNHIVQIPWVSETQFNFITSNEVEFYGQSLGINATGLALGMATNPTLGNGTLRVKIYHKTITFGA
jgi:hypothetical protein